LEEWRSLYLAHCGALAFSLIMVAGLVMLIIWSGLGFFWPIDVTRLLVLTRRHLGTNCRA
jgi:ABC-type phosphate transport system auxiliary subunit